MNEENDNQRLHTEEDFFDISQSTESKFQVFLQKGKKKDSRPSISRLSFTMNSNDLSNIMRQQQFKHNDKKHNIISIRTHNNHSKSFLNRSLNEQSTPIFLSKDINHFNTSKIKLPSLINVNDQITKDSEDLNKAMFEVLSSFDNLNKSRSSLNDATNKLDVLQRELKEAKESRNQVLKDVYQMRNEIEVTKTLATEGNTIATNYMTQRTITNGTNTSRYMTNATFTCANNDNDKNYLEEQIELYENKICKLKADNTSFFENYDVLKGEYQQNQLQNSKLKAAIAQLDLNIQNGLKDKANLKSVISKLSDNTGSNSNNNNTQHKTKKH